MSAMARPKPIQLADANEVAHVSGMLRSALQQAEAERKPYIERVEKNRELLKANQPLANPPWPGACELHIPMAKYYRNALHARLCRALLRTVPLWNVEPFPSTTKEASDLVELFLDFQARYVMRVIPRLKAVFQMALDDGVAGAYIITRTDVRRRNLWREVGTEAPYLPREQRRWERVSEEHVAYEGPWLEPVAVENFGVWPVQALSVESATGLYLLLAQSGDELLMRARTGDYDEEQVESLRAAPSDADALRRADLTLRGIGTTTGIGESFHGRVFQIADCYWRYAREEGEPASDWLFTIETKTGTLLRAIPDPWSHGLRPLVVFRAWPDRMGITGDSVADLVGDMQRAATAILRQLIDATAMGILPECKISESIPQRTREEIRKRRGPGGLIPVPDAFLERGIAPIRQSAFHPISGMPLLEMIRQVSERAVSLSDIALGKAAPRTITATEVEELLQEGAEPLAELVDEFSWSMSCVGDLIRWLDYEMAPLPTTQRIWRQATGDARPGLVGIEELGGEYSILAAGTAEGTNRALQAQRAEKVLALVTTDPASTPEQVYAARLAVLQSWGVRNPERFIGTEAEFGQRMRGMAQAAVIARQAPQGPAQAALEEGYAGPEGEPELGAEFAAQA